MLTPDPWPPLPLNEWQDTYQTLHMWTQLVGKIRMTLSPPLNHWWHATLYVNARGLTTSPIPYENGAFEIQFDFLQHQLEILCCGGTRAVLPLQAEAVAVFYGRVMEALRGLGIEVAVNTKPQEVPNPIPFEQDYQHASYDRDYVQRFFRILVSVEKSLQEFRSGWVGKSSPVQFFWGAMDLSCVRFSGRPAVPPRKGRITGNTHEEVAVGFSPAPASASPHFTPTPRRPRRAWKATPFSPPPPRGTRNWASSFCATKMCAPPPTPQPRYARSSPPCTKRPPNAANGTGPRSNPLEEKTMAKKCTHLDGIHFKNTDKHVCEDCVKLGDDWVHLRLCLSCGHVGCCDSSKNKHATKHFHHAKHPLVRSIEPGESWVWCYVDEDIVAEL